MKNSTDSNRVRVLSIALFLFIPLITNATTYYVDRNHASASDANSGTIELPWLTIQHAAETAVAGDIVYIRTGTYNEHVYIENNGNTVDGHIVFSAYPGDSPIIDGTDVTESQNGIIMAKSYIKLLGLELRNWNDNAIWIENAAFFEISDCVAHDIVFGIGVADGSHDFVFNRVEIHHYDFYGIDVSTAGGADCYNGIFNDCISHTGRDPQQNVDGFALGHGTQHDFVFNRCITYNVYDGFDISARNSTLNRCLAYDCWNGCYKLWQDNVKLFNCIGYNSGVSIVELDWDEEPGTTTLFNCTFFNSQTFTIWIENAADTLHMYNCLLAGGDNIGLAFEQMGAGNYRGDYNIFHNDNANRAIAVAYTDEFTLAQVAAGDWTTYSGQDGSSLVAYSDTDIFADPTNFDLHLIPTSPAVNNGTSDNAPLEDFDGNPRPIGGNFDIGAYEYDPATGVNIPLNPLDNFALYQNYPNPFNAATTISYQLPITSHVELSIYSITGQKIETLISEQQQAGYHRFEWDGSDMASGVYFYRLSTFDPAEKGIGFVETRKFVLLK